MQTCHVSVVVWSNFDQIPLLMPLITDTASSIWRLSLSQPPSTGCSLKSFCTCKKIKLWLIGMITNLRGVTGLLLLRLFDRRFSACPCTSPISKMQFFRSSFALWFICAADNAKITHCTHHRAFFGGTFEPPLSQLLIFWTSIIPVIACHMSN